MKTYVNNIILRALIITLVVNVGCYNYYTEKLSENIRVPNSEKLLRSNADYSIDTLPVYDNPVLSVTLRYSSFKDYKVITQYAEKREVQQGSVFIPRLMMLSGALAMLGGGIVALGSAVDSAGSEKTMKKGGEIFGAGLLVGLIGYMCNSDDGAKYTGKVKQVDTVTMTTSEDGFLENEEINIKINNILKVYTTNSLGQIRINLVQDYGLNTFENRNKLSVEFQIYKDHPKIRELNLSMSDNNTFDLHSADWTREYCEIIADEIKVFDSPGTSSKFLGVCKKGEKYLVNISNKGEWINIVYGGGIGWISSFAAKSIWRAKQ